MQWKGIKFIFERKENLLTGKKIFEIISYQRNNSYFILSQFHIHMTPKISQFSNCLVRRRFLTFMQL